MRAHGDAGMVAPEPGSMARVHITKSACLTEQRPSPRCTACGDACPAAAIRVVARHVSVDEVRCIGCGRCASACPTGAIEVAGFAAPAITSSSGNRLACRRVPPTDTEYGSSRVPCLGGLTVDHLLQFTRDAAGDITLVGHGWCRTCPAGLGEDAPWASVVTQARRLVGLATGGKGPSISVHSAPRSIAEALPLTPTDAEPAVSRRLLFTRLLSPSQRPAPKPDIAQPRPPTGTVSTAALRTRRETLAALSRERPLPAALFPAVAIAQTCCDNRVCTSVCPTSALASVSDQGATSVHFDASLCISCGECEGVCPTQSVALLAAGQGVYEGPIVLRRSSSAECATCGRDFIAMADEAVCGACRKDTDLAAAGFALMRQRPLKEN